MSKGAASLLVSGTFLTVVSALYQNGWLAFGLLLTGLGLRALYVGQASLLARIGALEALVRQMRADAIKAREAEVVSSAASPQSSTREDVRREERSVDPAPGMTTEAPPEGETAGPAILPVAIDHAAATTGEPPASPAAAEPSASLPLAAFPNMYEVEPRLVIARASEESLAHDRGSEAGAWDPGVIHPAAYEIRRPDVIDAVAEAAAPPPPPETLQPEARSSVEPSAAAVMIEEPMAGVVAEERDARAASPAVPPLVGAPQPAAAPHRDRVETRPAPAREPRSSVDIEQLLGVNWLSKVGVAILVIGISFFLAWQLRELGPLGKDMVGTVVGVTMLAAGIRGERNERYRILARAVLAGGWALLFFLSYAAHHVTAARVVDSTVGALLLMLLVAGAMVIHTLRYRSQVVTALAFSLAFVTLAINRADAASLSANLILAVGFSVVVVRMRWYGLEIIGIAATYLNHYMWMRPMLRGSVEGFPEIYTSATILVLYWAIFRTSFAIRRGPDQKSSVMAGMLNSALLLTVMKVHGMPAERAFWPLLALGVAELGIARLPRVRERRASFVALTTIGVALFGAAIPFRFAPGQVTPVWLIDAVLFTAVGIITAEAVYRRLGTILSAATAVQLIVFPVARLFGGRYSGAAVVQEWSVGLICLAVAIVLHAESTWLPRRWPALYALPFDRRAADVLGYVALGIAMIGGWAIFPAIGTAVFWGALAVTLTVANRLLPRASRHLAIQSAAAAACAFGRVVMVDLPAAGAAASVSLGARASAVVAVAVLLYVLSRLSSGATEIAQRFSRIGGAWAGTAGLALLASYELPRLTIAIGWTAIAVVLLAAARRIDVPHLGLQANVLAAIAVVQFVLVNLPVYDSALTDPLRVSWRVLTALGLATFVYVLSRRNGDDPLTAERWCSVVPLWVGSTLLAILPWYELRTSFVTLGWTAFVLALAFIGRRFDSAQLTYQAHLLAGVSFLRVLIVDLQSTDAAMTGTMPVTWRLLTMVFLTFVLYVLSHWGATGEQRDVPFFKVWPSWAAATLLVLLLWAELPRVGVVLAWSALAFVLAAIGHRLRSVHLIAQANVVAYVALAKVLSSDLASTALLLDGPVRLTWHAVAITAVASLFYVLSRWNGNPSFALSAGFVTVSRAIASALVVLLAWHELLAPAVLVGWTVAAFAFLYIGRRYRISDLAIHADAVALIAIVRVVTVDLPSSALAFGAPLEVPWRMIAVPLAAALLYSLSRWNPLTTAFEELPQSWFDTSRMVAVRKAERFSTVLALTAGTAVLVLLAWYQLRAPAVVLAWSIFAIVLLELGVRRVSRDLLLQAHVLLFACVARVFVVNMNINDGASIGARAITIVPVVIALLYAYERGVSSSAVPRVVPLLYAWCAVMTVAALLRVHLTADAVIIGWASLVLVVVAFAAYTGRRVFLHTGLALAVASLTRAILHNLYERSYFPPPGAFDTWLFVGATAAILFASLPFAFRARFTPELARSHPMARAARWIDARPEQLLFFTPLLLVTVLIATDMSRALLTVAWGIEAVAVFVFALWVRERTFRLAGIGLLLLCVAKVFLLDFWSLTLRDKALTGIVMGLALIGVSLLYTRNRETILKFL